MSRSSTNGDILTVSSAFRQEAAKAIGAILVFITVYFLLFTLALGLAALCFVGGIWLITAKASFYTLIIGGGIMGFGVMVVFFLIKFLFATSRADSSDSIEITAADDPRLFAVVEELAAQTGTPRPRKIFLSSDVNACVFYNSSFWSLFLPVRKNLKIGLGLVNTVNASELKAVIAHEFGHFSQRSMKVGSWVYIVNRIIHDMLFNNSGYAKSLDAVGNLHGILSFFVGLTVQVAKGIQWVLQLVYRFVNKRYLALSRQMEFHADLVSASICGTNAIVSSLRRLEFADASYSLTMQLCNSAWADKKVVSNFYSGHRLATAQLAALNKLQLQDGLPLITGNEEASFTNRVNVKNQWASHPTLAEREAYLEPFGLTAPVDEASAWTCFSHPDRWKEALTKHLYATIPPEEVSGIVTDAEFAERLIAHLSAVQLPPVFGAFYDNRLVAPFDAAAVLQEPYSMVPFAEVLTEERQSLPKRLQTVQNDVATLQAIVNKEIDTRSFDFDGKKYIVKDAPSVLARLEGEAEALRKELEALDVQVFRCCYAVAPLVEAEALKAAWQAYFAQRSDADNYAENANTLLNGLAPLYSGETMSIESAAAIIGHLKDTGEPWLKRVLQRYMETGLFVDADALREKAERFLKAQYAYYADGSFFDTELSELNDLVQETWAHLGKRQQASFKALVERQAALLANFSKVDLATSLAASVGLEKS